MPPILALEKISKRFGAVVVASEIDLVAQAGEALGIIGPNGAGKTTLFGIMTGTIRPDAGRVLFAGEDIPRLTPEQRCRGGIARAFQVPQPFAGMTVFENLVVAAAFGRGRRERDVYQSCGDILEQCGLAAKANRLAGALTLLDRKRLELARAVAAKPDLLLLDEIGGGLTDAEASELVGTIGELRRRNIGIVWIEHIVHVLVRVANRLICMDAGRIIADGKPEAVMADPEVVRAYLGGGPK